MKAAIDDWLQTLGYDGSVGVVHRDGAPVRADHPYAREIDLMLRAPGSVAAAVFDVDDVPAVCFVQPDGTLLEDDFVDRVRSQIWNQNLVSIVVVVQDAQAVAYPVARELAPAAPLQLAQARSDGPFSASEVARGEVTTRLPDWFDRKSRVDRVMQENLVTAIERMRTRRLTLEQAQLLLGKVIFVTYLEHRGIVGEHYRARHRVQGLLELLRAGDGKGLDRLFRRLKSDFNGDLLEIEGGSNVDWRELEPEVFDLLAQFLLQTRLKDEQTSLWPYDFKYIPVELLSGIYETFLGGAQREVGAFYTPRHLAMLAVEEAFRGIERPWEEVVLDGACGSGILLTTAYRRMLGAARARAGGELDYEERQHILLSGIRGGDTSSAACKVTAFSLYLALLEDLTPSDIARLQEDQDVKLPPLLGDILTSEGRGDFFSPKNRIAEPASATIVISNPPWYEPAASYGYTYEQWWRGHSDMELPSRQIVLAFARRASEVVVPGGRVCLLLPVSSFGAAGSQEYLKEWFREVAPERVINLADMRFVPFEGADHPTVVFTGRRRKQDERTIPPREQFDYIVPKADVSLLFGRLTAHSFDRKRLYTMIASDDPEVLRTYFWGGELDESLIARLRLFGTIRNYSRGEGARFVVCKGFHRTGLSKDPISSKPLHHLKFLSSSASAGEARFPHERFFVQSQDLKDFPTREMPKVADLGSAEGRAFSGVRVIFPDGVHNHTLEPRARFTDKPMCFMQTLGAIVDTQGDRELMLFLTAYLRSQLARYLLFYTSFSLTMERPHVKLREIEQLPFVLPERHKTPEEARQIVRHAAELLKPFQHVRDVEDDEQWAQTREQLEGLVFDYFGLTDTERRVVADTCEFIIPSRLPRSLRKLRLQLFRTPAAADFGTYTKLLKSELDLWRERLNGQGRFRVDVTKPQRPAAGAMGVVRITMDASRAGDESTPPVVDAVLQQLRSHSAFPHAGTEGMSVASDLLVYHEGEYFFVKPLIRRLWLATAAAQDAWRIVQTVRDRSRMPAH